MASPPLLVAQTVPSDAAWTLGEGPETPVSVATVAWFDASMTLTELLASLPTHTEPVRPLEGVGRD